MLSDLSLFYENFHLEACCHESNGFFYQERNPRSQLRYRPVYGPEALCIPGPKSQSIHGNGTTSSPATLNSKADCWIQSTTSLHKIHASSEVEKFRMAAFRKIDIVSLHEGRKHLPTNQDCLGELPHSHL